MERDTDEDTVSTVARTISNETRLSFKQATALLMREVLNKKDKEIAEVLDISPASSSSYVSACKSKFDSVDEEIDKLEREIVEWEKTKQLEGILTRLDFDPPETAFRDLSEAVENELANDKDVTYLMKYVDEQGQEQVQSVRAHPKNVDEYDNDVEVVQYRRISSVDEMFE